MYFRQFWQDPRLSFDRRPGLDKLVVGAEYIKLIWVPDTFFVNEKTAYFHDATTDNQFVRIFHTGDILRSIRYGSHPVKFTNMQSDVRGLGSFTLIIFIRNIV